MWFSDLIWGLRHADVVKAGMEAQMQSQREYLDYYTPKGPLWFWEYIPQPYTGGIWEAFSAARSRKGEVG